MGHQEGVKQGPSDFPLVFPDPTSPADCSPQALGNGCSGLPPRHPRRPCLAARVPGGWEGILAPSWMRMFSLPLISTLMPSFRAPARLPLPPQRLLGRETVRGSVFREELWGVEL